MKSLVKSLVKPLVKPLLTIKNISIVFAFAALCALAASGAPDPVDFPDAGPWYSIVPPLLAVCLALLTNRLLLSLLSAVLIGGLLVSVPDSAGSMSAWTGGVGTGLGLSIVHQIIEKHTGRIDVTSKLDVGTTVQISLPTQP